MAVDRRARIREYKDTPRPMGVYRVLNRNTGDTLIGTSVDMPSMLNRHRAQLNMGAHPNRRLQEDWNALGPDAFTLEVLDTLSLPDEPGGDVTDDLVALQDLWIEKLAPNGDLGYGTHRPRS